MNYCQRKTILFLVLALAGLGGCHHRRASVTAVPLSPWNQCEPEGIPYYLPKPLLIVSKNVRHIDESKVGLTDPAPIPNAFDNQAAYADLKANVTVPGSTSLAAANTGNQPLATAFDQNRSELSNNIWEKVTPSESIKDGLEPDSFFTYQIVFVPDLTQKYGLRIKGGPGEIRAAMNLVNGWMYTGMGPYYMKDSSTAQNLMAIGVGSMFAGRGAADVLEQVGDITRAAGGGVAERAESDAEAKEFVEAVAGLARVLKTQEEVPKKILNYAEIYIYEPHLTPDGVMAWEMVAHHNFDRDYFSGSGDQNAEIMKQVLQLSTTKAQSDLLRAQGEGAAERGSEDATGGRSDSFNPNGSPAAGDRPAPTDLNEIELIQPGIPATVNDIDVNVETGKKEKKGFNLFPHHRTKPKINRTLGDVGVLGS